ncbi:MAG: hypothetical protein KDA24_17710 [Deltaproteobacteria bacterium]|nr:hypothetical protein [Deltaproteobacteria bacterium]
MDPASGFLLDHILAIQRPTGVLLRAPVAGSSRGITLRWSVQGAAMSRLVDDAWLPSPPDSWTATVELLRGEQVLASQSREASPPRLRAAATHGGALIGFRGATPQVTVDDLPATCAPQPAHQGLEVCFVEATRGSLVRFGDGVVTAGALPTFEALPLEETPDECGHPAFPAPVAGGILGCSHPGQLDRHRRRPGGPRRAVRWGDEAIAPTRASVLHGGSALAVAQGRSLGTWTPDDAQISLARALPLAAAPAADGGWFALLMPDRMQALPHGSNRRVQPPAIPAPGRGIPRVAGGRVAWAEPTRLMLGDLRGGRTGPFVEGCRHTVLSPGWITFSVGEETVAEGLVGQLGSSFAVDSAFSGARATFDDLVAVPARTGDLVQTALLHPPSGLIVARLGTTEAWVEPRGSDADGLVVRRWAKGATGELARHPAPLRVLEEDGSLGFGAATQAGGHGGGHALLAPGEQAEGTIQVASPARLATWRPDGPSDGWVEVEALGTVTRIELAGSGWLDLAALPRNTEARVRFVAAPRGEGLAVDALMLDRR